ncbi:hypothetical protein G9A89_021256 [Geosiphon pyriformis]|nr:hypothetical protein G9A89_021256 [Geosiphon pyriformis]
MEEKCLVEKTSFNYSESGILAGGNLNQTPTGSKVKTKKALGKPLGKIDFSLSDIENDVLLNTLLELPPFLKNLVNISVCKFFVLNIGLDKFAGIIKAMFTSELSLAVVLKKISVGTSVETVHAVLSEFESIKSIKIQLVRLWQKAVVEFDQINYADLVAAKWSILIGKDVVHKTCIINQHPITYAWVKCVIVCFDSAKSLNAVVETTSVLRRANLWWSCLGFFKCAKCKKIGHTLLDCSVSRSLYSGKSSHMSLSNIDKSRLAAIYSKCSVPIAHPIAGRSLFLSFSVKNGSINPGSSSKIKPILPVTFNIKKRFAVLESSLTSLIEQINELAKKLDLLVLTVSQPSPGYQLSITSLLQNQVSNIVIGKGSGETTNGKTAVLLNSFFSSNMVKFKNMLKSFFILVLSLLAYLDSLILAGSFATCNVRGISNSAKQKNIVYWHVKSENMIMNRFDDVRIFSSGLDKEFLGAGMAIIMNNFLVYYVSKVKEILGWVISVCLLFKDKLSVIVLGLYADASSGTSAHLLIKASIWSNSRDAKKTIDYIFVNDSLFLAVTGQIVASVSDYFDTNHKAVVMLVGLGGLLDVQLNGLRKQANKD